MMLAVPATVAFAPVQQPEAARWEPQLVALAGPAKAARTGDRGARAVRWACRLAPAMCPASAAGWDLRPCGRH